MADKTRYVLSADDIIRSEFLSKRNAEALLAGLNASGAARQLGVNVGGSGTKASDLTDGKLLYYNAAKGKFMSSGLNHNVVVNGGEVGEAGLDYPGPVFLSSPVQLAGGVYADAPTSWTTLSLGGHLPDGTEAARFAILLVSFSAYYEDTLVEVRNPDVPGAVFAVGRGGSNSSQPDFDYIASQSLVPLSTTRTLDYKFTSKPSAAGASGVNLTWSIKLLGYFSPATGNSASVRFSGTASMPATGATAVVTHGLGYRPNGVRAVLECITDDSAVNGYVVGDEVNVETVVLGNGSWNAFVVQITDTTVRVLRSGTYSALNLNHKTTGLFVDLTPSKWRIKAYWSHSDGSVHYTVTSGAVRQTVQAVKLNAEQVPLGGPDWYPISGLSKEITVLSGSKVRIQALVHTGGRTTYNNFIRIRRTINGTTTTVAVPTVGSGEPSPNGQLASGIAAGNGYVYELAAHAVDFIDTPTTAGLVTYFVEFYRWTAGLYHYINRAENEGANYGYARVISTLTLSELTG